MPIRFSFSCEITDLERLLAIVIVFILRAFLSSHPSTFTKASDLHYTTVKAVLVMGLQSSASVTHLLIHTVALGFLSHRSLFLSIQSL